MRRTGIEDGVRKDPGSRGGHFKQVSQTGSYAKGKKVENRREHRSLTAPKEGGGEEMQAGGEPV